MEVPLLGSTPTVGEDEKSNRERLEFQKESKEGRVRQDWEPPQSRRAGFTYPEIGGTI